MTQMPNNHSKLTLSGLLSLLLALPPSVLDRAILNSWSSLWHCRGSEVYSQHPFYRKASCKGHLSIFLPCSFPAFFPCGFNYFSAGFSFFFFYRQLPAHLPFFLTLHSRISFSFCQFVFHFVPPERKDSCRGVAFGESCSSIAVSPLGLEKINPAN